MHLSDGIPETSEPAGQRVLGSPEEMRQLDRRVGGESADVGDGPWGASDRELREDQASILHAKVGESVHADQ